MKLLKYLTGIALMVLIMPSCSDELDLFPPDQKIPEFNRIEDFEDVLIGCYSNQRSGGAWGENLLTLDAWAADDMKISPFNNGQGAFLHNWTYVEDQGEFNATWIIMYRGISRCNTILINEGNFSGNDQENAELERIVAEARVLRAMYHLYAYTIFGERYGDGSSLGVPYVTSVDITLTPDRPTSRELLDILEQELEEALPDIIQYNSGADEFTVNPAFVEGLLARIALLREDWQGVVDHATNAIDLARPLAGEAVYTGMWDGRELPGENIFKVKFSTENEGLIGEVFWVRSLFVPYFNPTADIVTLFDPVNDVRYTQFFDAEGTGNPLERVYKYRGTTDNVNLADAKVMRTSEMYLMRAEAYAELGQVSDAAADVQAIRDIRVRGGGEPVDQGNILEEVLEERRKELCYEGFRMFDLKRRELPIERQDCSALNCTLPADCFLFIYPIPQSELFANDNIQQNPVWGTSDATPCFE